MDGQGHKWLPGPITKNIFFFFLGVGQRNDLI